MREIDMDVIMCIIVGKVEVEHKLMQRNQRHFDLMHMSIKG